MGNARSRTLFGLGLILLFSFITIWSTASDLFIHQLAFLLAGVVFMVLISRMDLNFFFSLSNFIYIFSILLLLVTLLFGKTVRGSTRWLDLGLFPLQTSELVKPLLLLFYADYIDKHKLNSVKKWAQFLALAALPTLLILRQPDLGSAIVIFFIPFSLAYLSNLSWKTTAIFLSLILVIVPVSFQFIKPYQMDRLTSFVNPYADPTDTGYNVIQSTIAIGSGKIIGKGAGLGTQSHLEYLPERHTDFIFASFVEEFGLIGALLLIGGYLIIINEGIVHARTLKNDKHYLVQLGVVLLFSFQLLVNVGMNLGLMPVTGITLPLFSYGGSSLISFMILLGLHLNLLDLSHLHKL